jgi:hypothetical protein
VVGVWVGGAQIQRIRGRWSYTLCRHSTWMYIGRLFEKLTFLKLIGFEPQFFWKKVALLLKIEINDTPSNLA